MTRSNIVVLRAGPSSLHPNWLDLPYSQRSFDLLLSFYSEEAFSRFQSREGVTAVLVRGGKWDGLFRTLSNIDLDQYDRYWLPDDDIDTTAGDINSIFRLLEEHDLAVAQPALSRDSHFSHFLFHHCKSFRLRYTNYVEIMVPCLTRSLLKRVLPLFEDSMSGYGLDYVWCRFPESGAFRCGIIDEVCIHHTRPVGKILKAAIQSEGKRSPDEEEALLKARLGLTGKTVPITFAGIKCDGQPVAGRVAMTLAMMADWIRDLRKFEHHDQPLRGILRVAQRQITNRMPLSILRKEVDIKSPKSIS